MLNRDHIDQDRFLASQIRKLTKLAHLLTSDIKASIKQYKDLFRETLNIDYVELAFKEFENNLCMISKDVVIEACNRMTINPNKNNNEVYPTIAPEGIIRNNDVGENNVFDNIVVVPEYEFRVGTRLFELYLALQSFNSLSNEILPQPCLNGNSMYDAMSTSTNSTHSSDANSNTSSSSPPHHYLASYYLWFLKGVSKWLDIALLKAIKRIFKAVALDDLKSPVDELVQHTSSAVDIKLVFGQVNTSYMLSLSENRNIIIV